MAGAYLYRLMKADGFGKVDLYDIKKNTKCGCRPCAWGFVPSSEYRRLTSRFLEPDDYELHRSDSISVDDVKLKADFLTIDKPRLIGDLVAGDEVLYSPLNIGKYDRVIDATGVSRAFLGPAGDELIADCVQYRVRSEERMTASIHTATLGYRWCFPLGSDEYHLGFGNLRPDIMKSNPFIGMSSMARAAVRCRCLSRVRLSSPYHSRPFVQGKVVGVGESIGTVSPLAADGNVYAMQCAEMLVEHWDDLDGYTEAVLERYDWMRKEREVLDRLRAGKMPSLAGAMVLSRHFRAEGIKLGLLQAIGLFGHVLREQGR